MARGPVSAAAPRAADFRANMANITASAQGPRSLSHAGAGRGKSVGLARHAAALAHGRADQPAGPQGAADHVLNSLGARVSEALALRPMDVQRDHLVLPNLSPEKRAWARSM